MTQCKMYTSSRLVDLYLTSHLKLKFSLKEISHLL